MPISAELRELLVCPKCKGELDFPDDQDEIRCLACLLAYPIVEGIPTMLVDEARPLARPAAGG